MDTIIELQRSEGFTAILIIHDLGIVLEATERVLVMHEGGSSRTAVSSRSSATRRTTTRRCCCRTTRTRVLRW